MSYNKAFYDYLGRINRYIGETEVGYVFVTHLKIGNEEILRVSIVKNYEKELRVIRGISKRYLVSKVGLYECTLDESKWWAKETKKYDFHPLKNTLKIGRIFGRIQGEKRGVFTELKNW